MAEARCYCGSDCTGCGDCRHWGNYSCYCGEDCSGCSGCTGCSGCSGTCKGACKDNCGRGCNTGCSSNEALNLYNTLVAGLNQKIYAADMKNINRMIEIEAGSNRNNVSITSVSFKAENKATSKQIKQLQSNLKKIGQTTSQDASQDVIIAEKTGKELITKVLKSADTKIKN